MNKRCTLCKEVVKEEDLRTHAIEHQPNFDEVPWEFLPFEDYDYYEDPQTDEDFIQIAIDVYGNSTRDNSKEELVLLGKEYHETGEE